MRVCPHCGTLVSDDTLIICPKCKSNLNTYYKDNKVFYYNNDLKNDKNPQRKTSEKKKSKIDTVTKSQFSTSFGSKVKNAAKNKIFKLFPLAIIYIILIAVIIIAAVSLNKSEYVYSDLNSAGNNHASYCDSVFVAMADDELDEKIKSIEYDQNSDEYILNYKMMPDFFNNLKKGDVFVVEADEKANDEAFQLGFSGKITSIKKSEDINEIKFKVADFTELFESVYISTLDNATISDVKFYPNGQSDVQQYIVPMAVNQSTEKFSLGGFSAGYTYKKSDKESSVDGYEILAKKLKLKISHTAKTTDDNKVDLSGDITFDYPAVKFLIDYDNTDGNKELNHYDVGFIAKEKANLKIKASGEIGAETPDDLIEKISIIDFSDATDEENGKVVLGTYVIGYNIPSVILHNNKNNVSYLSLGISVQVSVTLNGKVELECGIEQSGYLDMQDNSNGDIKCNMKNYNYPNPVIDEIPFDNEQNYDDISIKSTVKGSIDVNLAVGTDIGFCILGSVPLKLSTDIVCLNIVKSAVAEKNNDLATIEEDGEFKNIEDVSFYQIKSQSNLIFNLGAQFKLGDIKYEIGKISMKKKLFSYVWEQFPKPVDFSSSHCDFGDILIDENYSKDAINDTFYKYLDKKDKNYLTGKVKDKFLQSTSETIINKINLDASDIFELLGIDEQDYDIVCFSEGAIYLLKNGKVSAELISGSGIENSAHISCGISKNLVRQIYSEPDDAESIEISFGEVGAEILKLIGADSLLEYNGTNLSCYTYKSDDSDNELMLIFDGSDKLLLAVCN